MPFTDRLSRAGHKAKKYLGVSSNNSSSTSLPATISSSPSFPPATQRAGAPLLQVSDTLGTGRSSSAVDPLASNIASSIPSSTPAGKSLTTAVVPNDRPSTSTPPPSAPGDSGVIHEATGQRSKKAVVWSGLKTLLKVVESSSDVFPPLKSAVSDLHECIDIFESASKGHKEYQELQSKLDSLLGDLSEHIDSTTSSNITMGMRSLCIGLNKELALVQDKSVRGGFQRHAEALEDTGELMECYRRIQGNLERLMLNANLSTWKIVDRVQTEARLQRLSPSMSAVYNSAKSEEVQRRACTPRTRQGELQKLLAWAYSEIPGAGDIYWINGMAGTGKTTISFSLCEELKNSARLGASFFCSRLIPECRDIGLIIPSIAYQLARFSRPFYCALSKVLEADPDIQTRALKAQFESLLVEPLLNVKRTLPADFVVVIDGLDECEHRNSIEQILDILLSQTSVNRLPIRFLLSSRPEPEIYYQMTERVGGNPASRLVLHDLDEKTVKHDIETYLHEELKTAKLTDSQLASLSARCGVLFIYASTAARYIRDGIRFEEQEDRLNMILGLSPTSSGGSDRDIDALYTSILQAALEQRRLDDLTRTRMKMLLDTIICAQEPLNIDGLARLLKLKSGTQAEALLRPLSSVVNIVQSNKLVTTLHASFPDYMRDAERSHLFHCNVSVSHRRLVHACLEAIGTSKPRFNVCGLPSSYLCDADVNGLDAVVKTSVTSWLFYACRYWMNHVELAEKQDEMRTEVHEFLSTHLLFWMEILNLRASMHLGPRIMQLAESWSRISECDNNTIDLAHDAWRFVTMYTSHAVSQSTPHIYISMLPFWPESAPVSRHYAKRLRGIIRAHGSAVTRRQFALLATWPLADSVYSICLSPDENLIAYAAESSVWVIDGTTSRVVLGPLEHSDRVNSVAFSPNGALIVSGSNDNTVKVWQTSSGQLLIEPLLGHTELVNSASFSPDGKRVISGSPDGTIRVWSLESGRMVVGPLQSHNSEVWSISVSSDGARIASGHDDGTIQIWGAESGQKLLGPYIGHTDCVRSVCFSPDGIRIASGSDDNTIRVWNNPRCPTDVDVLQGHTDQLCSVAFSPNGEQLVSGSLDFTVRLWNVDGPPQLARVFTGHTNVVWCVRFSSDGARIVSSSGDGTIRVWDARSQGPADSPLQGHSQAVTSVAYSHDGTRIVSGSNDGTIYVWDRQSGEVDVGPMEGHTGWVNSVCVSPDQTRIASGSNDKTIQLWDTHTGTAIGNSLTGHSGKVLSVCFSPDGALLASGSEDETIRLWNTESGEPVGTPLEAHTDWVRSVCFSPNGLRLVSGSSDMTILVWDVTTREAVLPPFEGHTGEIFAICASPDGNRIASGSGDTTVGLWDAHSGQSVSGPLQGHNATVESVCFSPDSSYIVSGSYDKTIRLWDVRSGQTLGIPLIGHTDFVRSAAFSPNGKQIVSGSEEGVIRVWDIANLAQPQQPKDDVNKATEPSNAHQSWALREDGWVVDPQSHLLAWVPPDLHASLMNPRNPLLISTNGFVRLELGEEKLGESWSECYEP